MSEIQSTQQSGKHPLLSEISEGRTADKRLWQPFAGWIKWWFCNQKYTPMAQIIIAMIWGILLSPWSSGLFALVIFIIVYEILFYVFTGGDPQYYSLFVRTGVIYTSIFGYILGRTLSGDTVCEPAVWPNDNT